MALLPLFVYTIISCNFVNGYSHTTPAQNLCLTEACIETSHNLFKVSRFSSRIYTDFYVLNIAQVYTFPIDLFHNGSIYLCFRQWIDRPIHATTSIGLFVADIMMKHLYRTKSTS